MRARRRFDLPSIRIQRDTVVTVLGLTILSAMIWFLSPESLYVVGGASAVCGITLYSLSHHFFDFKKAFLLSFSVSLLLFLHFSLLLDLQTFALSAACIAAIGFYLYT